MAVKDFRPPRMPRLRLGFSDAAVVLGVALLLFSTGGMLLDSSGARIGWFQQPGVHEEKVIRRAYHPPALDVSQAVATLGTQAALATQTALAAPVGQAAPMGQSTGAVQAAQPTQPGDTTPMPSSPGAQVPPAASQTPAPPATAETGGGNNSFLVPGTPAPTAIPSPEALVPQRIVIPAIHLDAPVLPAVFQMVELDGQVFQQWDAPNQFAAGWQQTSALLGAPGNTVLNGHHNIDGMVFGRLLYLKEGDAIEILSGDWIFSYTVTNKMILPERGEPLSVRLDNARWLQPTTDERLTLVTCWPPNNNTYRLFIVARPVGKRKK